MSKARKNIRFILLAAVSLDGRITRGTKKGSEWTSKEDKAFFQGELDRADAVIMGRKTFEAIRRPLTPRNRIVFTHSSFAKQEFPRVTRQHLFSNSQEFENRLGRYLEHVPKPFPACEMRVLVAEHSSRPLCSAATVRSPTRLLTDEHALLGSGTLVLGHALGFCGSPEKLLSVLKHHGWKRVAILGGTSIYGWFLKRRLVDELYLTVEPVIFGTGKLLSARFLAFPSKFKLVSIKKLNAKGTLLLHYEKLKVTQVSK